MSPASQSASSGCTLTATALENPAFSKARFHASAASRIMSRYWTGVVFSIQNVIGSTGSDTAADGSFLTRCQRVIGSRYGVALNDVRSVTVSVK